MQFQNMTETNISRIIGIQFSILSPDEIRKSSVAHITSRDTYVNNKPVINGLFDPRMGVLEPGLICPTDGLTYMQTPGYFGHMELARPVFYIQYLTHINKILRCVCIKCSKLLISKDKYKEAMDMNNKDRWDYVFENASKVKRCGEENDDGCGCKQPDKIKKDGLASLYAEWSEIQDIDSNDKDKLIMKMTPEIVLKIFRRISDDDVNFMGFSSLFSRPDWMVCQVLAIPPPAVRPSVKHDSQQRSEDDLSHIIVNIIKANKTLQEKIEQNAKENVIEDWTNVLQYYIAMMVNNNIPGVASVAQRSGRPLKSIIERLNGKGGRVRGNLMGKRVDFSARSVITADPNLSIRQLGVPLKIAMNITYPVKVTERNINTLKYMVVNGPDKYPGAKILEKKNGENISLRYVDRLNISLNIGDIVHRHMIDNDPVLFNRQPTLHRMSMMCHLAKIMKHGNTFRMNVADTKPYNADFDGDEMNMHMPQDDESRAELLNLAIVPRQIISPANNSSIVGIFQDSLLGCYRFTRENISFTPQKVMNLLMKIKNLDLSMFENKDGSKRNQLSNFDVLTQILPPLYLKFKNNSYDGDEDDTTTNNIIEIINGVMKRGQLDKNVKKLIHTIFNDFGYNASADFIDNIQNIITEYMKMTAFSVGISDLIADSDTNNKISRAIMEKKRDVNRLIEQVQIGVFENNTGKSNYEEFETSVNSILNKAMEEAGKIGRKSLSSDNRFKIMVDAGSKGSHLNIAQMISCLGQQNVDGKRIPYGFEDRTLPHYTKYNDSPEARGFVESSFIQGLTPQELFFHAMGGRVGLIDTAVKSVSWETPIIIIENDVVHYTEIGKWVDERLENEKDKIKYEKKDNMEILDINGVMISTTDMSGRVYWADVTAMTRHDPGDELFKITTQSGRDVIVTSSKSLIVWDPAKSQFEERYTKDISVGDCLPSTMSLSNTSKSFYIISNNIVEQFKEDKELIPNMLLCDTQDVIKIVNMIIGDSSVKTEKGLCINFTNKKEVNLFAQLCNRMGIFGEFEGLSYNISMKPSYHIVNDVVLDAIIRIENIDVRKHKKMYDLTIPKTLNFGLANGLQVRDTSQTGYIQRRLIKGMEDLKVEYDMTVRNNMSKIVQFTYGDDNIDTTKVEGQVIPLSKLSISQIYEHFEIPKDMKNKTLYYRNYFTRDIIDNVKKEEKTMIENTKILIQNMIKYRDELIYNVFKEDMDNKVNIPVNFQRIIENIKHQLNITKNSIVNITPLECHTLINDFKLQLDNIHLAKPTELFYIVFDYYINPKQLIFNHRFHRDAIMLLLTTIVHNYKKSLVAPGEMVGMLSAQSIGEPTTQMTLNTFHLAGVSSKSNVTRGVPRIEEILSLSKEPKNPSITIHLKNEERIDRLKAQKLMYLVEHTSLRDVIVSSEICFDPDNMNTLIQEDRELMKQYHEFQEIVSDCIEKNDDGTAKSKWVLRFEFDKEILLDKNITMDDIHFAIENGYSQDIECIYSDYNSDKLVLRIRLKELISKKKGLVKTNQESLDQSDEIYMLKNIQDNLMDSIVLKGIPKISKVTIRKIQNIAIFNDGDYDTKEIWVLDTVGSNLLDILSMSEFNPYETYSNNIMEMYDVLGIEAARQSIFNEFQEVIQFDGTYINYHHLALLCDRMCYSDKPISIFRHGINNDNIGPIAKASFEETPEMFLRAARHGEIDNLRGVSANVMCGQLGNFGTSSFQVVLDMNKVKSMKVREMVKEETIDTLFKLENVDDPCSINNIKIVSNVRAIQTKNTGEDNDYDPGF